MKNSFFAASLMLLPGAVFAANGAHWDYVGNAGPESWGKLTPEYGACSGRNQSPINLTGMIDAKLQPLVFNYDKQAGEILNNGHTVQINVVAGNSIKLDGTQFDLKQFHFHAPSENLIKGKSYPLEGHLVHADKDGNLAVIAVMFKEGKANKVLTQAWKQMPKQAGDKASLADQVTAMDLLPAKHDYYRFNGSLTTPPCSEGVRWIVMKNPMTASKEQIEAFAGVLTHPNNRPVQPLNARTVME
tara:strand:- start:37387 stop:38118 length:732 start_codon:yes stop_codon:yes gene_type:complete